jgi:amino acid permease
MTLNLLVGEVVARTNGEFQLVGLARKYLGKWGGIFMTILNYLMAFGILVVYIIGEGQTLYNIFGGNPLIWSVVFFVFGGVMVMIGLETVKTAELVLSMAILLIILLIAGLSAPHVQFENVVYSNWMNLLLPYGVILFAFSGASSIPEAHAILKNRDSDFKKAIVIAGTIAIVAYALFTLAVVGVTGSSTTEIATVGLGAVAGKAMFLFGNLFAIFAMGTCFLMGGVSLKDSLHWDYKMPNWVATLLVCGIPFVIFLLGMRSFIAAIDIVGGVFISLEMLVLVLIYWRAKTLGHLRQSKYKVHNVWLAVVLLVIALTVGAVYSVVKLF